MNRFTLQSIKDIRVNRESYISSMDIIKSTLPEILDSIKQREVRVLFGGNAYRNYRNSEMIKLRELLRDTELFFLVNTDHRVVMILVHRTLEDLVKYEYTYSSFNVLTEDNTQVLMYRNPSVEFILLDKTTNYKYFKEYSDAVKFKEEIEMKLEFIS